MKESNERIIERIRKLLAMANDTSSPHEAAIAAERARKLMDAHQIDYDDIDFSDDDFNELIAGQPYQNYPLWKQNIAINIAKLNDCVVSYKHAGGRHKVIRFQGFSTDVELCKYLFDYLVFAAESQFKTFQRNSGLSGVKVKNTFLSNFRYAVVEKIKAMIADRAQVKTTSGRDLVVVKSALVSQRFGSGKYHNTRSRTTYDHDAARARDAGRKAGQNTSIHRGVTNSESTKAIAYAS